jgi:hypothetical protein
MNAKQSFTFSVKTTKSTFLTPRCALHTKIHFMFSRNSSQFRLPDDSLRYSRHVYANWQLIGCYFFSLSLHCCFCGNFSDLFVAKQFLWCKTRFGSGLAVNGGDLKDSGFTGEVKSRLKFTREIEKVRETLRAEGRDKNAFER